MVLHTQRAFPRSFRQLVRPTLLLGTFATPLLLTGCGGGSNSGPSLPVNPTPVPVPSTLTDSFALNAVLSNRTNNSLSPTFTVSKGQGSIDNEGASEIVAKFAPAPETSPSLSFDFIRDVPFASGDSFSLPQSTSPLRTITYAANAEGYSALSGTFTINSVRVNHFPGTDATSTTVTFTISNARFVSLVGGQNQNPTPKQKSFTMNATGNFTVQNTVAG